MIHAHLNQIQAVLSQAQRQGDNVGFTACSTDTRRLTAGALYVALRGERFDGHDFIAQAETQGAAALLVDKPIDSPLPSLQVPDTRIALGELARWWRTQWDLPVVAVTGSNGKTTVKEMLASIFRQITQSDDAVLATLGNLNNDIGVPLSLFRLGAEHRYAVIEMGANHSGEIAGLTRMAQPQVALITQCAPAHLEGFNSIEGVAQAKGEIFQGLREDGTAVINQDDHYADYWRSLNPQRNILSFGVQQGADVFAQNLRMDSLHTRFDLHSPDGHIDIQLALLGQHNVMNALAAAACALACGCQLSAIQAGLQAMQPVKGRLQRFTGIRDSVLIDDTYNANPTSLQAALQVLAQCPAPRCLVIGDMLELGEEAEQYHRQAGINAREAGIERLYTTGSLSRAAAQGFGPGAQHFAQQADLIAYLQVNLIAQAHVLVKGSRGLQMEKVVQALTA